MQVANYSEFRKNMKQYLDKVVDNHDELIIHRQGGKSVVILSIDEYNSMDETEYLTSTAANKAQLDAAIANVKAGLFIQQNLIEVPENDNDL